MPRIAKWLGDTIENLLDSKFPLLTVIDVRNITDSIKRITFQGEPEVSAFSIGSAVLIRVSDTEYRNYTPSAYDAVKGVMEIIVHVHGSGPGSKLMNHLRPGDVLRTSIPRGIGWYRETVPAYILWGDETSLGLAYSYHSRFVQQGNAFHYYFELNEENREAPAHLGLSNYTVFKKGTVFNNPALLNELPVWGFPENETTYVVTGNVKAVQTIRKVIKTMDKKGRILSKGFWLEGKTGL
ncbi:siderophore-interacting protein [Gynurincola endophyticus]|uniref:siderophore-interacting protein n=1 Tax=Gynurincola endophyticus TaxID=2479004 RepID=UPI000F8D9B49|nr:FAD-binding oxidoreductase [Gynurincola endophyticus]